MQMKKSDIPIVKEKLLKKQKNLCPICGRDLSTLIPKNVCLDHNHDTWMVRATLCRFCNAAEAKIKRTFIRLGARGKGIDYVTFLKGLLKFQAISDTKYRYPEKAKKRKKKKR